MAQDPLKRLLGLLQCVPQTMSSMQHRGWQTECWQVLDEVQGTYSIPASFIISSSSDPHKAGWQERSVTGQEAQRDPQKFTSPREGYDRGWTLKEQPFQGCFWHLWLIGSAQPIPSSRVRDSPAHMCIGWPQPVPALTPASSSMENGVFYLYVSRFI